jgi:hypothetical protein
MLAGRVEGGKSIMYDSPAPSRGCGRAMCVMMGVCCSILGAKGRVSIGK